MRDRRFDNRSQSKFAADMKHSTTIEQYIFYRWAPVAHVNSSIRVLSHRPNGCDNTGEYLPTGTNTAGADFWCTLDRPDGRFDMQLEVKLVPRYDFLTLKAGDLMAYVREGAAILFVLPRVPAADLRMSRGLTVDERIAMLESERLEWGIMWPEVVRRIAGRKMTPQECFGFKPGVRIERDEYKQLFKIYPMRRVEGGSDGRYDRNPADATEDGP